MTALRVALPLLVAAFAAAGCGESKEMTMNARPDVTENVAEDTASKLTGHCHCGKVSYEIAGPVAESNYCGCPACRRASGTFKVPFVRVKQSDFRLTGEQPVEFDAEGGEHCDAHGTYQFCPHCGTQVYWKPHEGDLLDLFAGTLDDPSVFDADE